MILISAVLLMPLETASGTANAAQAADIADTINWNKVKNVNGLVKAGEVYEKSTAL